MFRNYLAVALRNFRKNKLHSFVNITGLALGFAAATMIFLFARYELNYDAFHENADSIYLIYKERITPTSTQITDDTWVPMADALKNQYPHIVAATRFYQEDNWLSIDNRRLQQEVTYADPSLFDIFSFKLADGVSAEVLKDPHAAALSREMARKYFGDQDPVGREFSINYETRYTVKAVLEEYPDNSSFKIDVLVPFASIHDYNEMLDEWRRSFIYTFLQLPAGLSPSSLEEQFPAFVSKIWNPELNKSMNLKLRPLLDFHDQETGARQYAFILLGIAVMILTIASINFINLTTARSLERAREIGMRKVLGAVKAQLVGQFMAEAILMTLLALVAGVALVYLLLPQFNTLYGISLQMNYLKNVDELALLFLLAGSVGFFSGLYPAFVISGFEPVKSLRGTPENNYGRRHLRSAMVVAQFAMAVILIVGTVVMWRQVAYMKNANLNFHKEGVLAIAVRPSDFEDREAAQVRLETFKDELRHHSNIVSVASSTHTPGNWPGWFTFAYPTDRDDSQRLRMRFCVVDDQFFQTYGIEFSSGRNFERGSEVDKQESLIVNEAALKHIGWPDAENRQIRLGSTAFNVIGVVKDYHYQSLAKEVAPVLHRFQDSDHGMHRTVSVKLGSADVASTLAFIAEQWAKLDAGRPFEYTFVDEDFNRLYENEDRLATITGGFTVLAVLIACMGLFALASLLISQRTKEIGIRKTLGASVDNIVLLLSGSFLKLVCVAFLLAAPIAYWAAGLWLNEFAYRMKLDVWVFVIAGLAAGAVALLAISQQAVRAALGNPIDALKCE